MDALAVFKSSRLFSEWTDKELQKLTEISKVNTYMTGESLFSEGSVADSFFLVGSGSVTVRKSAGGDEELVGNIGSSSHFGELGLLSAESHAEPRSATVEAAETATVVEVPYQSFSLFLEGQDSLGAKFYRNLSVSLAARIRMTTDDLASLRALKLRHL